MATWISQRKFAALVGRSIPYIIKRRDELGDAMSDEGKVNVDSPNAIAFIESQIAEGIYGEVSNTNPNPTGRAAVRRKVKASAPVEKTDPLFLIPEDIRELADRPLRDLANIFGSDARFVDWLKSCREMEIIHEKRLKNAVLEGTLVSRDLVHKGVIDILDAALRQLLNDGPPTISRTLYAKAKAGRPQTDAEQMVRNQLERFIKEAKDKMQRGLRDATRRS